MRNSYTGADNMIYSFDSNIFIDMKKKYQRGKHDKLWERIEILMIKEEIIVSKQVVIELERKDDGLASWIKTYPNCIIDDELEIQSAVTLLVRKYIGWIDPHSTLNKADPYVIAAAIYKNGTVVSSEGGGALNSHFTTVDRMLKQAHAIKIIDVCDKENVKWVDLVGFLVEQLSDIEL